MKDLPKTEFVVISWEKPKEWHKNLKAGVRQAVHQWSLSDHLNMDISVPAGWV